jgi:hypothetical protein
MRNGSLWSLFNICRYSYNDEIKDLTHCKRNQLNPITLLRENVQNRVRFCCFGRTSKYTNISAHFGRFLWAGWSDWTDSFCIASCFLRHKFRLPTYYYKKFEIPPFDPPLRDLRKYFLMFWVNVKISHYFCKLPDVLSYIGHHIRYLLYLN